MTAAGLKDPLRAQAPRDLKRPSFGHTTGQARVRLRDGMRCEVEEGTWRTRIDQSVEDGRHGKRAAPRRR